MSGFVVMFLLIALGVGEAFPSSPVRKRNRREHVVLALPNDVSLSVSRSSFRSLILSPSIWAASFFSRA